MPATPTALNKPEPGRMSRRAARKAYRSPRLTRREVTLKDGRYLLLYEPRVSLVKGG